MMDKVTAKQLGDASRDALERIAEQFGMQVKVAGGRYDPTLGTFTPKVVFSETDSDERKFAEYATMVGVAPDDFGKEFRHAGERFKVTGVNPRAQRLPILASRLRDGRTFKFTSRAVLAALAREWGP